jgi:exosortase
MHGRSVEDRAVVGSILELDSTGTDVEPPIRRQYMTLMPLIVGIFSLLVPTIQGIAQVSWATEQGAHGPIVLAIGIWLLCRAWPTILAHAEHGSSLVGAMVLVPALLVYLIANIVGSIVIQSAALYLILVVTLYLFVGLRAMRGAWFPIIFLLFVLPPPGSFVANATQPLRLQISEWAVIVLANLGYPVARSGLDIFVGQYILEIKSACGGLNSMISLTAIGLVYAYMRHNSNFRYSVFLLIVILFLAVMANFVRVIVIILMTYYLGDRAAQGFLHQFAGLTMFVVAMGGLLLFDEVAGPIRRKLASRSTE